MVEKLKLQDFDILGILELKDIQGIEKFVTTDKNGNIVWIKDILTDIQPYYYKFSNKFRLK